METKYLILFKLLSIISGFVFIIFALLMMYEEIVAPDWKIYQNEYAALVAQLKSTANQIDPSSGIRQIEVKSINHIDRCITCHINIDQSRTDSLSVPFSEHPGTAQINHDLAIFACTLCHNGIGRSLRRYETCDKINRSEWRPIESQCAHCHLAVFDSVATKPSMPAITEGLKSFLDSGCLGCHKLRGVGGPFGPDLTSEGRKIFKAYNFKYILGEKSVYNWQREHLSNPQNISPGSIMPNFSFQPQVQNALVTLILGFSEPLLPLHYYDLKVIKEFKDQREATDGETAYQIFCSSCHETTGKGRDYKSNAFGVPTISNPDFQAVASVDMISFSVNEGRSGRYMPSWRSRHSGVLDSEIINIIRYLRQWRRKAPSWSNVESAGFSADEGSNLYAQYCATCHGKNRTGGIGPNLLSGSFLSLATDRFLYRTLVKGRSNTAMPSWSRFDDSSLKSLIRFLQPTRKSQKDRRTQSGNSGNTNQGQLIFHYQCSRCHGSDGLGGIGPAILNRDFLESADDNFIIETIKQGRNHTPMFKVEKSASELNDLLAYMRAQKNLVPSYLNPGPSLGNPDLGKDSFQLFCAECHGKNGEGIAAPALNNQEFLNAGTNGYLLATITLGRAGTAMPAWGLPGKHRQFLTTRERQNIVSYIRQWQKITIRRKPDDPIYKLIE